MSQDIWIIASIDETFDSLSKSIGKLAMTHYLTKFVKDLSIKIRSSNTVLQKYFQICIII